MSVVGRRRWLCGAASASVWLISGDAEARSTRESLDTRPDVIVDASVGDLDVEVETTKANAVSVAEASLPPGFSVELRGNKRRVKVVIRGVAAPGSGRVRLSVPERARITVRTRRGDIEIAGLRGEASVSAVQGDIAIGGSPSRVEAKTTSGDIRVVGVQDEAELSTVSGDIHVSQPRGRLDAETVSGGLRVTGARVERSQLAAISGGIDFDGEFSGGSHAFEVHSGNITVQLEPTQGLRLQAQTFSGVVEDALVDPPIRTRGSHAREHGDGAARLDLSTFSGDIRLSPRSTD